MGSQATAIVPAVQKLRDQAPKAPKEKSSSKKKASAKRKSDESADEESGRAVDSIQPCMLPSPASDSLSATRAE